MNDDEVVKPDEVDAGAVAYALGVAVGIVLFCQLSLAAVAGSLWLDIVLVKAVKDLF